MDPRLLSLLERAVVALEAIAGGDVSVPASEPESQGNRSAAALRAARYRMRKRDGKRDASRSQGVTKRDASVTPSVTESVTDRDVLRDASRPRAPVLPLNSSLFSAISEEKERENARDSVTVKRDASRDGGRDDKRDAGVTRDGVTKVKRRGPVPDSWVPSAAHTKLAAELRVNLELQAESFRDYHRAHGKVLADVEAAFRNWLRKSTQFAPQQQSTGPVYQEL